MKSKATHLVSFHVKGFSGRTIRRDLLAAMARRQPDYLTVFVSTIRVQRLARKP